MRTEKCESLRRFLEDVDEQIGYKPIHAAVNEELCAHVEDKAEVYMEFGVEEEEAYEKAVRDMGDASAIGIQMNEAHHLRLAKPLLIFVGLCLLTGILGNILGYDRSGKLYFVFDRDSLYFLWGIVVLEAAVWRGYPFILKHTSLMVRLLLICCLVLPLSPLWRWMVLPFWNRLPFWLYSPSVQFGVFQVFIPFAAVLLYRRRHQGMKGILLYFGLTAMLIVLSNSIHLGALSFVPILTVIGSGLGILLYMIGKGYLAMEKRREIAAAVTGTVFILLLWSLPQWERVTQNVRSFVHPEDQVQSAWDDAYNNVLIRELLGRAKLLGEIDLSQEELTGYYTSEWYFTDGEGTWMGHEGPDGTDGLEWHVEYKKNHQGEEDLILTDILPQHYRNNYRIAWWILRYGWLTGLLLTLLPMGTCVVMFLTALRLKNRLGRTVGFGVSLAFAIQLFFYLLGNFGFQFGMFGNLPFISEGYVSITGSALMAGLLLSAYRFDTVIFSETDR